ncbi:uncharacterized protein LOC142996169 [Genypterus blacodes]|uniref:uncharacterized protein LOC142996169 n=1 Tax=Genypterus blacodes TaxID=154954 RepID=UPI003F76BF96
MAQQGIQLDQAKFCCSICLDLLKDPVAIPCGHSYCMRCIKSFWDGEEEKKIPSCPQCRQTFTPRPVLVRNTMLAELVEKLKKTEVQAAPADHCYAGPADVGCDFCTGRKLKAIKSCLQCLASYCQQHLQPHYEVAPLKKHKLVDPSKNLQENICSHHDEVMKMFCRTDQQCICYLCSVDEHKGHDTVSAAAERKERQGGLAEIQQRVQQNIQDREKDVKVLQQEVKAINHSADKAVRDNEEIFNQLICLIEKRSSEVRQHIRAQQKAEASRAEELQEKLEQEITELRRKDAVLQQLSHTVDHIQYLQSYPSLPDLSKSTHIDVCPLRYFEDVTAAVSEVRDQLQNILSEEWTKISLTLVDVDVLLSPAEPKTRAGFLKHSHAITMDPNTVDRMLLLSEGNRKATCLQKSLPYSAHPDLFNKGSQVLSRESLPGRCYWEVERSGGGVRVAVAYKDITRTGDISRFGFNEKSWSLNYKNDSWTFIHNSIETPLSVSPSSRIGVYLDHTAGRLSFYSVSDTMTLLHRVQTTFTQPLYAGIGLTNYGATAEFKAREEGKKKSFKMDTFVSLDLPLKRWVQPTRAGVQSCRATFTTDQRGQKGKEEFGLTALTLERVKLRRLLSLRGEMAQQGIQLDQAKLCCSICLDLLKDPVAIPCGHSYCMGCIEGFWDGEEEKKIHSCPQCRQTFTPRPVLVRNTMLADLVEELKKTEVQAAPADPCYAGPADVGCDFCTGSKMKAIKSCLQCLTSFCEQHLQPHYEVAPLKKHKLVDPSKNLQENICSHHDEVMKMFCRTDQQCICYLCSVEEHKGHDTVSAAAEWTERQGGLAEIQQEVQQNIQDREKDVKVLQQEVKAINHSADEAVRDNEEIFNQLICLIQKRSSVVKQHIRSQQKTEVSRAEELQEKLEQEITELRRKDAVLQQLSHTEDHIQFLQSYPSLPDLSESTHFDVRPLRYFEDVTAAVSEVRDQIQNILSEEWTKISLTLADVDVLLSPAEPKTRAGFLKHSHEITMDPNTVNTWLSLSEGNRKAKCVQNEQLYSTHPDRFTDRPQVLSRESLPGRCYWEVERRGRGVKVAVAYKDITRTGDISKFGFNEKSWSLNCTKDNSWTFIHNSIKTPLSVFPSSRIGVYLDHNAGLLTFYSVSDTMTLLHRVQTTFTQPLYAGIGLIDYGATAEFK